MKIQIVYLTTPDMAEMCSIPKSDFYSAITRGLIVPDAFLDARGGRKYLWDASLKNRESVRGKVLPQTNSPNQP